MYPKTFELVTVRVLEARRLAERLGVAR